MPRSRPASGQLWRYRLAVFLLPLLVLWHRDNALYSPPYYGDAWFYLGYFRDLLEFKRQFFYGFYYGSRLSWILPGVLIHSLFSPLAANAILHLAVQSTATLSIFSILRLTVGIRSAFLATMVFAAYPWLWVATGWDYVDGVGIAYTLLAMALLTRSAIEPQRKWTLLLAGAALAGMVYTHLFLAPFAPLLFLYFIAMLWAWHGKPGLRSILVCSVWLASGFVLVSLLLCCINYWLDGNFWFYAPSLARGRYMAQNFQFTRSIWFQNQLVPWLWPAVAGCLTAIVLLPSVLRRPRSPAKHIALIFSALLLMAVAYMSILQLRGSTVLGHYPYVSYLLPFIFLVMGASFWAAAETMSPRTFLFTCSVAALAFAALWYDPTRYLARISPSTVRALVIFSTSALAVSLLLRRRIAGPLLALAGFVAFATVSLAHTVYFDGNDRHGDRAMYQRIMHARGRIETLRHGRPVRFWYDQKEADFYDFVALNSTYLLEFNRVGTDFPHDCSEPIPPDAMIVVISQKEHPGELARSALTDCLQPSGVHPVLEGAEAVSGAAGPFTLATLRIEAGASPAAVNEKLLKTIELDRALLGDPKASIARWPEGILVTTLPDFGAFAARLPLGLDPSLGPGLTVYVRARVLDGKVGFGVLDSAGKTFLLHRPMWPLPVATDVILALPSSGAGDLIVDNLSNNAVSKVLVERIEIRQRR
ncbi:MAG TPA: hypothetical protein VEU96_19285 [Bryobacteraceae bacterium]|nr:hypothetical protein [Bryobacteraceae bacterium]